MARSATSTRADVAAGRARAAAPDLTVVRRSKGAIRLAVVLGGALFSLLFAVTAFQTRLAQNQLDIDTTDDRIAIERETYDRLRLQRAELLAPDRLMTEAQKLGMVPGSATEFVSIDTRIVAQVAVSASGVPDSDRGSGLDPITAYGEVKATVDGAG